MPAKRHHAVPQFYLRRFTGEDGFLWLHDLDAAKAVRVRTDDALVEKYLYAPEIGDDPHDDAIEKMFAQHVEGPAAEPIGRLIEPGEEISDEDRGRIAIFLAFQEVRVPRMRDTVQKFMSEVGTRILSIAVEHPEHIQRTLEEAEAPVSDEELEKMVEAVRSGGIDVQATKIPWLSSMAIATEIADLIYRLPWTLIDAPRGVEFLTSDAPLVKVLTDRAVPSLFAGGWLSPSAETTFALSPGTCLAIRPDGIEARIEGKKRWCRDVNKRLVAQANRFAVSRRRDSYVEKLAKKRP